MMWLLVNIKQIWLCLIPKENLVKLYHTGLKSFDLCSGDAHIAQDRDQWGMIIASVVWLSNVVVGCQICDR